MIEWLKKATKTPEKLVEGDFKFYIKSEPQVLDTATTLTVTVYTNKSETAMVPCHFRWFRIRNGLKSEIIKYRGSSYVCEASDIGSVLVAEVISNDQENPGKAILQFGPVKLAIELKKHIVSTLINGSSLINAAICMNGEQKQCQFKIFEDMIKICHTYSELNYSFDYSIYEPRIQISAKDSCKVIITFGEKYENSARLFLRDLFQNRFDPIDSTRSPECKMQIKFGNRFNKDLFILTLKAFYTKKELKNSVVIHKIEYSDFREEEALDYLFQIESLKSDVSRIILANEKSDAEKMRLKEEVGRLEHQIEEIITTYTKIVEEKCKNQRQFNESYSILTTKRDEVIGKKYKNLEHENADLNNRIQKLSSEIDEIRFNTSLARHNQTQFNQSYFVKDKSNYLGTRVKFDDNLDRMLEQLSESNVREVPDQFIGLKSKLDTVSEEKLQLQKKLQKSFKTIEDLEQKLRQKNNHTAVNISYSGLSNISDIKPLNQSMPQIEFEKMTHENKQLHRKNDSLMAENRKLMTELSQTTSKIIIKPVENSSKNSTSINNQRERQFIALNEQLKMETTKVDKLNKQKNILLKKIDDLSKEVQIYKKNQDVMNRSQNLSMEMDNYNEEQLRIMREHNEFLVTENEKLTKICEKYMVEARENSKLKKEIIELKSKLNKHLFNPEHSFEGLSN